MGYSYTFKEREINFADETRINYQAFLLSEFFNASDDEKVKILNAYKAHFGISSYNYMLSNYWYSWQLGYRKISNVQADRICSIMPQLLNDVAIQKLGTNDFMMGIKDTVKSFLYTQKASFRNTVNIKNPQELVEIFEKEFEKIKETKIRSFRFNVLTHAEKKEALEIAHYILKTKLQMSFEQIERDFNTFLPYMYKFKRGAFTASYLINNFNLKLNITKIGLNDVVVPKFKIKEIEANSNFKSYAEKYLAYELVALYSQSQKAISNSFLNANDIKLFFDHYEELSLGDSEVNMNSTFQGEGGVLSLKVQMKPLKLLKSSIMISSLRMVIYFIVIVTLVSLAVNNNLFIIFIFVGFLVGIIILSRLIQEAKELKLLLSELKKYGK